MTRGANEGHDHHRDFGKRVSAKDVIEYHTRFVSYAIFAPLDACHDDACKSLHTNPSWIRSLLRMPILVPFT
jgi:hypothetical protein